MSARPRRATPVTPVDEQLEAQMLSAPGQPITPERRAFIAGAAANLTARDPEYIRRQLPLMWLLATMYFRAEVRESGRSHMRWNISSNRRRA